MSSLEAKPDSYMRIAREQVRDQQRVDHEAGAVLRVDALSCRACPRRTSCARVDASRRAVMIERTTSTSGSTGTGLKKCMPITRPGCEVSAPSFMIGTDEVFEARNCGVRQQLVEPPEDVALELLVLDDGLDRGVGALEVLEAWSCRRAAPRPRPVAPRVSLPERTARSSERSIAACARATRCVVGLDHRHVDARARADLRDPRAHQPTADDTDSHGADLIF